MALATATESIRRTPRFVMLLAMLIASAGANAQSGTEARSDDESTDLVFSEPRTPEAVDELFVTGSHIRRSSFEGPSPVEVIDREDLAIEQPQLMSDFMRRLPANSGSEFQEDQFTANTTSGTASINLRGLGLSSTLVLLNGKRAVASPGAPNSGATFVDINNFPVDLIERVEIVKDGTAALYGSDAVAGVVNFITRKHFTGFELNGSWQTTTRDAFSLDAQEDRRLSAVFGAEGDTTRMSGMLGWLDRTSLDGSDRSFTRIYDPENMMLAMSSLGNPPSFIPQAGPLAGLPFPDPECGRAGTNSTYVPLGIFSGDGFCYFQFADAYQLVADETRIDGFATLEHDFTNTIQFYGEMGFNFHRNKRTSSPSYPALQFPTVPAAHPGNPTASGIFPGLGGPWDVTFLGRAFGTINGANDGREVGKNELDTWRAVGGLRGALLDLVDSVNGSAPAPEIAALDSLEWDVSYLWSQSRLELRTNDVLTQNFVDALNGLGGTQCDRRTASPGDPGCFYFNPFGSAIDAQPGDATYNDPDVIADILAKIISRRETSLQVVDGVVSGNVAELPGGGLGVALGGQFRHEEGNTEVDDNTAENKYIFTVGTPPAQAQRDVAAVFGELQLPIWQGVETQVALRYERYSTAGDSTDPKVGLRLRPFDWFGLESPVDVTLRGNFSTGFRAPSLFQESQTQTVLEQLSDGGSNVFRAVRTFGSDDLKNEDSTTWSGGVTLSFLDNDLSLSVDFWSFDYEDIIVKPSAQALLDASLAGPTDPVTGCPLTGGQGCRAIIRDSGTGVLQRIETEFFNAASTETNGFDFGASYHLDPNDHWNLIYDFGAFDLVGKATYIRKYEIQESKGAAKQDVVNQRNFKNFASSLPELRFSTSLIWKWKNNTLANTVNYVSAYRDDECLECTGGRTTRGIDALATYDITYSYFLDMFGDGTILSLGLLNALNEDPPPVATSGGYDTRIHDPRGRLFQVGLTQRF